MTDRYPDGSSGGPGRGGPGGSTGGSGGSTGGSTDPADGSGSVSNGDWAVVDISPTSGFVDTFNVVYVFGSFPEPLTVWFGNSAARTVSQSKSLLIVETDRRAQPGVVDVSLRRQSEEVLLLPQAYSFVSPDGGGDGSEPDPGDGSTGSGGGPTGEQGDSTSGGGSSTGTPTGGTGDSTGGSDATGDSGGDGDAGGSTGDPGPDDGTGGDVPTDGGSDGDGSGNLGGGPKGDTGPRPRASVIGDPSVLDNGLVGVPVSGVHVVGPIPSCGIDPCRARRV